MKKNLLLFISLIMAVLAGCTVESVSVTNVTLNTSSVTLNEGETMKLVATVSPSNADNKVIIWSSSNASVASVGKDGLVTAVAAGTARISVTTDDGGKSAACEVTVIAPKIPVPDPDTVKVTAVSLNSSSLDLTEGDKATLVATVTPSNADNKDVIWSSSNAGVATVKDGVVSAVSEGSAIISVKTVDGGKTASCSVNVKSATVSVTGVSLNKTTLSLTEGGSETLTATVTPGNATNKSLTWKSSATDVATVNASGKVSAVKAGTATITVTTLDGGKKASCVVTVTAQSTGMEYVDLGLSVKWASFNLGATKPEELGGYYMWAGTEDVTSTDIYLDWSKTPYHNGSVYSKGWTKYIPYNCQSFWAGSGNPDNRSILDPQDDAAHVALGGRWRMPTDAEWTELRNNCTWKWTSVNGVKGYMVTGKKAGYTNKSIFLPAAGYRDKDTFDNVGTYGYYWSSTHGLDNPDDAYYMFFYVDGSGRGSGHRYYGRSIRPVYK